MSITVMPAALVLLQLLLLVMITTGAAEPVLLGKMDCLMD
jgi:hypothetical protein